VPKINPITIIPLKPFGVTKSPSKVKLVNILGAEVRNLFKGEIVSNYYVLDRVDLSTLETGIYFVKVVANGNIVTTDKIMLSK